MGISENMEKTTVKKSSRQKIEKIKLETGAQLIYHGVGRRKTAVARVFMKRGSGIFNVNGTPYTKYFNTDLDIQRAIRPLNLCSLNGMVDIRVNVQGSGKTAQSGAVQLGIARSIIKFNEELRSTLRKNGLLTVDSRNKERKKYGQKAARRKFQFVKR